MTQYDAIGSVQQLQLNIECSESIIACSNLMMRYFTFYIFFFDFER